MVNISNLPMDLLFKLELQQLEVKVFLFLLKVQFLLL
nr:MAG TPA: hypothetical protein [Caudoviricetes sp.]